MGQPKNGGYMKMDTLSPEVNTLLQQISQQGTGYTQQAAQGYNQFLQGGGDAIKNQALNDYQKKTIPAIMNAFGSNSKGSSALNQALASSGSDLNTNLASIISQLQLSAYQGLGNLGSENQRQALSTPQFAYLQKAPPLWLQSIQALAGPAAQGIGSYFGSKNNLASPTGTP